MTVYVCPIKDADCGDRVPGWCQDCPKRKYSPPTRQVDCRTCIWRGYGPSIRCETVATQPCINADKYEALSVVQLWRTK